MVPIRLTRELVRALVQQLPGPRMRDVLIAGIGGLAASGCGFILTNAPPAGHGTMADFSCTESNGGPIVDIVWASLNLLGALGAASEPDAYENADAIVSVGLAWTAFSGAAAIVGFNKTARCRDAKRALAARSRVSTQSPGLMDTMVLGVTITPPRDTLLVGNQRQLIAAAHNSAGVMIPLRTFRWSSSNDAIASVSNAGLVTAHAAGTAVIAANTENVVGTATVVVLANP